MSQNMVITTKVHKANVTNSIRTTIPKDITNECNIHIGDILYWEIEEKNGKKKIVIRKLEI